MPRDRREDELTRKLGKTRRRKRRDLDYVGADLAAGSLTPGGDLPPIFVVEGCATITIPASSIDANLTGFVVPFDLADVPSELWSTVSTTGQDLYVKTVSGDTRIPAHVVNFNFAAQTGFILFRAPTLSNTVDNEFLLCWGDDTADFSPMPDIDWTGQITNPDAETGDLTGWTSSTGVMLASAGGAHSGSFRFQADSLTTRYFQDIDVPTADEAKVDSGDWVVRIGWWQSGESVDYGTMGFTFLDAASAQLDEEWKASGRGFSTWGQREFRLIPPPGTRKIRIWMDSRGNSGGVYAEFDDIELALVNIDVNKQWGVWRDYIGVGFFESNNAINYGPGEPKLNIESFGGNSPVYSALTMGAGSGVTPGSVGAYRGFMGCPLVTNEYTTGVTIIPSNVSVRMVALGFAKITSASEAPDESQWLYHEAGGDYRIFDDVNSSLSAGVTLVNSTAYRAHCIYNGSTARRIYLDGIEKAEETVITIASNSFSTLFLCNEDQSFTEQWEGGIGYVWMRRGVVPNAWLTAEHLALSDPATFFNASVFGGTPTYLRYDPVTNEWSSTPISTVRDDLQANAPYGELAVANEWTAEQTYDDGSAFPAAFGTYTIQTTSPTTEDYPDGTLWVKTTSKIELWFRVAGAWLRLLRDAAFRRVTEDGSLRVTEAGDQRVMETVPVLLEITPKYIKSLPGYSFSRTGPATYTDVNGIIQTAASGELRNSHYENGVRHWWTENAATNLLLNSFAPATQAVTIPASVHTCSMKGSGSIAVSGATDGSYGTATEASPLTFTPSISQSVTFTVSGTVTHEQVETGIFPTSFISTAGSAVTRNADDLRVGFLPVPQEMTVYVKGVERGTFFGAAGSRIFQIGDNTDGFIVDQATTYRAIYRKAGSFDASSLAGGIAIGDGVELTARLASNGDVDGQWSINGGAISSSTPNTGNPALPTAWGNQTLWIGQTWVQSSVGFNPIESIRITQGINSMEDERAAAL